MRIAIVLLTGLLAAGSAGAQMGMSGPPAPPVGSKVEPAKALDIMLGMFEEEAVGVAKAMPADKYSFAPTPGIFAPGQNAAYGTVRTFAQQVIHLTQANYMFFAGVSGIKPDVDVRALSKISTKDEAVAAFQASFAFGHKAIATITADNAYTSIKPIDGMSTRSTLAAFAVAHGFDHYGQMVEYLRMNGVVPPGSQK